MCVSQTLERKQMSFVCMSCAALKVQNKHGCLKKKIALLRNICIVVELFIKLLRPKLKN